MSDLAEASAAARRRLNGFVSRCRSGSDAYRLTPHADESAYARCFAVFCRSLLGDPFDGDGESIARAIRDEVRRTRRTDVDVQGKPFRQLLAFSLSALAALKQLDADPLDDLVTEQVASDVKRTLEIYGCLAGLPGSGNQAMFTAVFLLHARDHLGMDTADRIDRWVTLHIDAMNRYGFWGSDSGMTHLQFQNGYHQYEMLEYLGVPNPRREESVGAVRSLADAQGHFAPYPGGGGCYDYDAVFVLTPDGRCPDQATRSVLERTAATLLGEQRPDGGFAESLGVGRREAAVLAQTAAHVGNGLRSANLFAERLRFAIALQRPRHQRIHTHWSTYSRRWDESDLWDSWFRMMTVARVDAALREGAASEWGFLDYPGIGYHAGMRARRF